MYHPGDLLEDPGDAHRHVRLWATRHMMDSAVAFKKNFALHPEKFAWGFKGFFMKS